MSPAELERRLDAMADDWEAEAAALASPLDEIGMTKANQLRQVAGGFRTMAAQQRAEYPPLRRRRTA